MTGHVIALCVCSGCSERKGHYDFAEAERRSLGAAAPCERCLKAQEVGELGRPNGSVTGTLFTIRNVEVHCNPSGNRLSDRHSTGGVPRYVRF